MKKSLFLLFTVFLLAACTSNAVELTPALESTPTSPAATLTFTPSVPTPTPLPTAVPTQAEVENPGLSETGPWLVYVFEDRVVLRNSDEEGFREISTEPELNYFCLHGQENCVFAPTGGRLARLIYNSETKAYEIWIIKLPELTLEYQITLDDSAAAENAQDPQADTYLIGDGGRLLWSPDGRYLAFSTAVNFPGMTLYVLDVETGESEIIFESNHWIRLLSWSFGGDHFAFQTYRPEARPIEAVSIYGYTFSSGAVTEFGAASTYAFRVYPVGWVSEDQLVTLDAKWEDPARYLRLLDFSKQRANKLSNYFIDSAAVDSNSGTILFKIGYGWWRWPEVYLPEHDLQTVNAINLERTSISIRNYGGIEWIEAIQLFAANNRERAIAFDERGTIEFEFEGAKDIDPSPDGELLLVYYADRTELRSSEGALIKTFLTCCAQRHIGCQTPRPFSP